MAKVVDVVRLYLAPPGNAVVLCVDERSQIEALERTATGMPMQPGKPAARTHDYIRHGTSTLFAALEIATGHVTAACKPRHRRQEFLAFLKQVARAYPGQGLHLVMDNYAVHKTPEVKAWHGGEPPVPSALHTHFGVVTEPRGGLARDHRTPGPAPGRRRLRARAQRQDQRLRHRLERLLPPPSYGPKPAPRA